ncbi:MAG: glutamine-hydrolyzing carbamoyl-phosphate synthase small subunit [Burkholderiaceae bacterium]
MLPVLSPAVLALADGALYHGYAIGAMGVSVGEVVFNTAMTGYQEILTDPSYCRQLVTLTCPHIGNTGITAEDQESSGIQVAGLIVRDVPTRLSNWRSEQPLSEYLTKAGIIGIAGLDTRALTRHLREVGAQGGCLVAAPVGQTIDTEAAVKQAGEFGGLAGLDLAKEVSTKAPYDWNEGTWSLAGGHQRAGSRRFKVVALDYGVKRNILRLLADRGCEVIVLPAESTLEQVMSHGPDGVFLSNGPGDPEPCDYAIELASALMARKVPLFGICLGHQIMALASGAKTIKMKNGHHGANHPVKDLDSGKVFITSQNHGFAVDTDQLPANLRLTHQSLFDGTVQGLARTDVPAFCFQGHPEASPGPHDIQVLFDRFTELMTKKAPLAA